MVVGQSFFRDVVTRLRASRECGLDTETTGLDAYGDARIFSLAIYSPSEGSFYFNWQPYADLDSEYVLREQDFAQLQELFNEQDFTWFIQNAKYDMAMLAKEGLELKGKVHCTRAMGRVAYNEHISYSLEAQAKRVGLEKDNAVEEYIEKHKLWTVTKVPGKRTSVTHLHFNQVPFNIISPYAKHDAKLAYLIGKHQLAEIEKQEEVKVVYANELKLTKTVFAMEANGLRVDIPYTERALKHEQDQASAAEDAFKAVTGEKFMASPKLFAKVFENERHRWELTPKGNPSFDSDILSKWKDNAAAKAVLLYRDAKSKQDFYSGFLFHKDKNGYIHPHLNPDGAAHGRFSSSEPNFQNLTSEDAYVCLNCQKSYEHYERDFFCPVCRQPALKLQDYLVRKAIIPPPGYTFIMPDYDQMEYRMMLDYAAKHVGRSTPLVDAVVGGMDVHQATAELASKSGVSISRTAAKTSNFLSIYGGGDQKLADQLKCELAQAKAIRAAIFAAAPEMQQLTRAMIRTAETRGFVRNWMGRRCYFPDSSVAYRAPNYVIAGGCADVNKLALNRIHDYLKDKKSKLVLTVHDENVVAVHDSELGDVPHAVKDIMEKAYPHTYVPLTCGMEYSRTSLAVKTKGFPPTESSGAINKFLAQGTLSVDVNAVNNLLLRGVSG